MTKIDTSPEAIAALLDGVTPGPWKTGQSSWNEEGEVQYTLHGITRAGYADCMFIAAARELVPALSARLAEVEAERDALLHDLPRIKASETDAINRAEAAEAALDCHRDASSASLEAAKLAIAGRDTARAALKEAVGLLKKAGFIYILDRRAANEFLAQHGGA